MAINRVVVIGASAGGLDPLKSLVSALTPDISAAVLVVMHMARHTPSMLERILARATKLPTVQASDGEPLVAGRIYCARPDCHLLVDRTTVAVTHGPAENRFRPSIDALFRSAA